MLQVTASRFNASFDLIPSSSILRELSYHHHDSILLLALTTLIIDCSGRNYQHVLKQAKCLPKTTEREQWYPESMKDQKSLERTSSLSSLEKGKMKQE
ncbi:hypothetical protein GCK32_007440 [Trichostrongylus colubriformis]|uniref:Uncharacterized protein n=1 Tax=Trichostrongylus colubriformis TaxID=6319 RepID=A0AAN8FM44_TRICO